MQTVFACMGCEQKCPTSANYGQEGARSRTEYRRAPEHVYLHLPWFVELQGATADGKPLKLASVLELPTGTKHVDLRWRGKSNTPALSYEKAVEDYKNEYRRRYERFLETGENGAPTAKQ